MSEDADAPKILYELTPQSDNSKIISTFIGVVESGQLKLLKPQDGSSTNEEVLDLSPDEMLPYIHTEFLIQEVSNLKLKILGVSNKLVVIPVVKKFGKDRFSSTAYVIWYIKEFTDIADTKQEYDLTDYIFTL